ncbi:MAG: tetratricopeptide repeat protein [Candidatus Omnitrophica bacterium]|nr:hypothetical protein [bacterium]MCC6731835.1 tetratricopeptide repeat protein [Candidatus Omnitrophota bacterium]MCE7908890.1 tetratricopeptide repeat protein [Candidatus Omnitrophica bacterium COP1]
MGRRGGSTTLQVKSVQYAMTNQQRDIPNIEISPNSQSSSTNGRNSVVFLVRSDVKKELERGKRKFESGDCEGAKVAYERALDLDPGCAIAYFYLGFTFHEMGNYEMAKEYYLQAIDLEKRQALFLEHLARLHFELEEYSVCLVRFQEAMVVGSLQPISYGLMGRAHYELDRFTEAIDCLEKMLEIETEPRLQRIAYYYLVLTHLRDNSPIPARLYAQKLLAVSEYDRLIFSGLAERFQNAGCLSLALAFLERLREESCDVTDRIEDVQLAIARADSQIPRLFSSDEEKLLHRIHFLSQSGTDRIYKVLLTLMETSSVLVKEAVLTWCRKFGYEVPDKDLSDCLNGPALLKEAAFQYMAETFEPRFLNFLLGQMHHSSRDVQLAVARYLERSGQLEHLSVLECQMETASGAGLRRQIQRAINQIKRRHTEETDKLIHKNLETLRRTSLSEKKEGWGTLQWIFITLVGAYLLIWMMFHLF